MPTPRYRTIADELRRRILDGDLPAGAVLPSENALATQYGVADETARRALGVLATEGLTESRRGADTKVRDFRPIRRRGTKRLAGAAEGRAIWDAELGERDYTVDRLVIEERPCPEAIAAALGLQSGEPVLARERRYLVEGTPVMLATSYLPASLVAGSPIEHANPGPGGIYGRLGDLGHAPVRFLEQVRFRAAQTEEAEALALSVGAPLALIVRCASAADGSVVEVADMTLDASRYVLEWEFPV